MLSWICCSCTLSWILSGICCSCTLSWVWSCSVPVVVVVVLSPGCYQVVFVVTEHSLVLWGHLGVTLCSGTGSSRAKPCFGCFTGFQWLLLTLLCYQVLICHLLVGLRALYSTSRCRALGCIVQPSFIVYSFILYSWL